ncbi:MAG TPA: Ig-like domain-containing protein [Longimicrobiaceae bacterium]|nr:Ig-like domain-containing protein [Longimicrobiaceae bacterium]
MISGLRRACALVPLAVVLLVGCTDGLGPQLRGAVVRIYFGSAVYDEQTIRVGDTVELTARVVDPAGDPVEGQSIRWSSSAPDVARVDANGIVQGVAVGTAYIIATHRVGVDSARVNVATPVTGALECAPGGELVLALGESRAIDGGDATALCLPGASGGSDYSIALVNTGSTAGARLVTRIEAKGLTPVGGGPNPALLPITSRQRDFHHTLRHDISARLEGRLRAGIDPADLDFPRPQASVGQVLSFNVETGSANGCSNPDIRGARVRAISRHAVVVADTLNPSGGFTTEDYQEFAAFVDSDVWPLVTGVFGTPSDIDSNAKVVVLFTRAVNERPENARGSGIYVGGFFFNRDLFPKTGQDACEGSNVAEMFYMLVPDPNGEVQVRTAAGNLVPGTTFNRERVARTTRSVLVHEFQHLVNDSRRLHVNRAPVWEETWLNEGLSHVAEELMFYRAAGLRPELNLGPSHFADERARSAFGLFQLDNLERLAGFLQNPQTNSLMGPDVLATRGAAWHFLRYAADRRPDEAALWRALVTDTKTAGLDNLRHALGEDPRLWIRDWGGAVYLDDTGFDEQGRYGVASWNLRALYPAVRWLWPPRYFGDTYPLAVRRLGTKEEITLSGAGAAYFRAGVAAGGKGAVRVTVGDLPAPSRLKVIVTRVK